MSVVEETARYFQVLSDGSVKRFVPEIAPASTGSSHRFLSKDVSVDPLKPITARIFLPKTPGSAAQGKLPVLVYYHGGGFCFGSTAWLGYHLFLEELSVASQAIVLSVDYRLAPENRLPAAYDDCCYSLEWLSNQVGSEPWLERADLSRVFLSGDSAGANISHNVALRAVQDSASCVKIKGLLLIHPYFGSEKRTEREMEDEGGSDVTNNDMLWGLSLPEGSNRDYFGCNFEMAEVLPSFEWRQFPAVVVYVAALDFLKERGEMYAEFLQKKGVKNVKLVEAEGEEHVYHVLHPESEATRLLRGQMSEFINSF
ncbi:probable carboxylesterase 17 [Malania oleifera]|uniref:probable carboxylesterase 17 n=1 Tax=Malania oleifera TaxID=397392 RepID=UPI0025AE36DC|nr:probable carboxylesterase 17 [Malania oleifera]